MTDLPEIVLEAMKRAGMTPVTQESTAQSASTTTDIQTPHTTHEPSDSEKLITDCVLEVIQMSCYGVQQVADVRRTLRSVLKALVKERDYITIGKVKSYVNSRNRNLVKPILDRASEVGLVLSTMIEATMIYKINYMHAEAILTYLEHSK